jgi:predicted amidophosphoribosyltransferase
MLRALASLLAPPLCSLCREPCGAEEVVCSTCSREIAASRGGGLLAVDGADAAWAATAYEGAGRRLVAELKFGGKAGLARQAARAIVRAVPMPSPAAEVVPVPADPIRLRMRGIDPAHAIAVELGRELGLPLRICLARRHGRRQVGRSREQRLEGGPEVRLGCEPPVQAVLVDDVITTGTTLAAAAAALREGGCAEILAVAFARA